jgi:hypothetical protein
MKKEHNAKLGRPKAEHGRERFTTMIDPELRDRMKVLAIMEGVTASDLFNQAVADFLEKMEIGGAKTPNRDKV